MTRRDGSVDLRAVAPSRLQSAALEAVTGLQRGETVDLLTTQEPSLMLQSLNLQLRQRLNWQISGEEPGLWRVQIRHREEPDELMDMLSRDHQRLDELFGLSLPRVNAGEVYEAVPLIMEFAGGLKRHVHVENDILAPAFRVPSAEPVATMLREHDDILVQLEIIASLCGGAELASAAELSPFLAILSGTMAKHENREEPNLFPQWDIALRHDAPHDRLELLERVQQLLRGNFRTVVL